MIEGLKNMDEVEFRTVAELAELDEKHLGSRDDAIGKVLLWMGDVAGCRSKNHDDIEQAVVEWMARRWSIATEPSDTTGEVEKKLRVKIAEEAGRHLIPFWIVGCAMAAIGPGEALTNKLTLMEKAAAHLVPSQGARAAMRKDWEAFCSRLEGSTSPLEALKPQLDELRKDPSMARPTLVLSLIVALADGRFGLEEEQFFNALAGELGLSVDEAKSLFKAINTIYWRAQHESPPPKPGEKEDPDAEKFRDLKAAERALENSGILEGLGEEVHSGFLRVLHRDLAEDPEFNRGKQSWSKTPFWPVGYAAGLCMYFRSRLRSEDHANLVRAAYLAILRQHLTAAHDGATLSPDHVASKTKPKEETPAGVRDATVEQQDSTRTVRRITLS